MWSRGSASPPAASVRIKNMRSSMGRQKHAKIHWAKSQGTNQQLLTIASLFWMGWGRRLVCVVIPPRIQGIWESGNRTCVGVRKFNKNWILCATHTQISVLPPVQRIMCIYVFLLRCLACCNHAPLGVSNLALTQPLPAPWSTRRPSTSGPPTRVTFWTNDLIYLPEAAQLNCPTCVAHFVAPL